MKIEMITRTEKQIEEMDYRDAVQIKIDGEIVLGVHDGEPEDNTLGRNFSDVYGITGLLQRAFVAGEEGEELEILSDESDDI